MQVGIGYKEDRMSKQRPSVISLLAALNAFAGALLFLSGIALLDGGQGTIFQDTGAVGVGLIFLIASGINFVIAVGMWRWCCLRRSRFGGGRSSGRRSRGRRRLEFFVDTVAGPGWDCARHLRRG
jgi:hypothetical protein